MLECPSAFYYWISCFQLAFYWRLPFSSVFHCDDLIGQNWAQPNEVFLKTRVTIYTPLVIPSFQQFEWIEYFWQAHSLFQDLAQEWSTFSLHRMSVRWRHNDECVRIISCFSKVPTLCVINFAWNMSNTVQLILKSASRLWPTHSSMTFRT